MGECEGEGKDEEEEESMELGEGEDVRRNHGEFERMRRNTRIEDSTPQGRKGGEERGGRGENEAVGNWVEVFN